MSEERSLDIQNAIFKAPVEEHGHAATVLCDECDMTWSSAPTRMLVLSRLSPETAYDIKIRNHDILTEMLNEFVAWVVWGHKV